MRILEVRRPTSRAGGAVTETGFVTIIKNNDYHEEKSK